MTSNELRKTKSNKKSSSIFQQNNGIIKNNILGLDKSIETKKTVSFTTNSENQIYNNDITEAINLSRLELKKSERNDKQDKSNNNHNNNNNNNENQNYHKNDNIKQENNQSDKIEKSKELLQKLNESFEFYEWDKFNPLLEEFFNKFLYGKSESDLTIYNFKDIKEKSIELLNRLFDSVIENQQYYVEKKKNDLQKDYEKHFNKYAPGYNIKKCSICPKNELFHTILISEKCKHPICFYCFKDLNKKDQQIFINEGDQKIKLDVPYFNCPLCNQINPCFI